MANLPSDPLVDEIREIRARISAQFDNDPIKLVAYYIKMQESYKDRLISTPKASKPKDESPDSTTSQPETSV